MTERVARGKSKRRVRPEDLSEIDELVFDFLDVTPNPTELASYWQRKAVRYRAAYEMSQRVVGDQATLLADCFKRIRVLENAVRMMEKEKARR